MRSFRLIAPAAVAAALLVTACSDDTTGPAIDPNLVRVDSVDASRGWTYLALSTPRARSRSPTRRR
jgi:hypothetical protein